MTDIHRQEDNLAKLDITEDSVKAELETMLLRAELRQRNDLIKRLIWDADGHCRVCHYPTPNHSPVCGIGRELRKR